jgi:hypothetical protein
VFFRSLQAFLFVHSPRIGFDFFNATVTSISNTTHAVLHEMILGRHAANQSWHVVSYLMSRSCNNGTRRCSLNGTEMYGSRKGPVILNQYAFMDYQLRWRSTMAVCGLSVALLVFALRHEKPRWGFISPESVLYCLLGDSAVFVTFFILKDNFDMDDSMGFGFVTVVSFFIPFYYMDRRFKTSHSNICSSMA